MRISVIERGEAEKLYEHQRTDETDDGLLELPGGGLEIDVDGLIGARDTRLSPSDGDWDPGVSRDPQDPAYLSPNMNLVENSVGELDWLGDEEQAEAFARLVGKIVLLHAAELVEPLQARLLSLREPVRTIATNSLVLDKPSEEIARCLSTSVATVEFLSKIACDLLASHIHITVD